MLRLGSKSVVVFANYLCASVFKAIDAWACIKPYEELVKLKETGDYVLHDEETELEIEEEFKLYEELAAQKR